MTWDEKAVKDMTPEEKQLELKKLDRMLAMGYGLIGDLFKDTLAYVQIKRRIAEITEAPGESVGKASSDAAEDHAATESGSETTLVKPQTSCEVRKTHHSFSSSGKDD